MSEKTFEKIFFVGALMFIAWVLVFGQVVETDHSGEIIHQSIYIHDIIINWWNNVKPF